MSFGENLRLYREEKHLSQRELATAVGLHHTTIAMYESGKRKPSFEALVFLATYFGVSVDKLVGDADTEIKRRLWYAYENADPVYQKIALELLESHQISQG